MDHSINFFISFIKYSFSFYLFLMSLSESFFNSSLFNLNLRFSLNVLLNNLLVWNNFCWDFYLFDNLLLLLSFFSLFFLFLLFLLLFFCLFAFFWMARRMARFWLTNWCNWLALFWSTWWVTLILSALWFWFTIIFSNGDSVGWSNQKW